ncbi:HAD-IA family hydrolase [Cytobacillus kochii]|nr:HAD-IA family hydrolase [Cytobacillus kochii]
MSNIAYDMGDPNFRSGAFTKYLEPIEKSLRGVFEINSKYLLSKHTYESIVQSKDKSTINHENSFIIDYNQDIDIFGIGDWLISKSYNNNFTEEEISKLHNYFLNKFKGWEPDLIFSWEFPTTIFRLLFPNALVIDLMPGLFMRPPFPRTISFDPDGLYKDSVFSNSHQQVDVKATENEKQLLDNLREKYLNFYEKNRVKELILSKLKNSHQFDKFMLVPLQVSGYFGFYDNCKYKNQFDFLVDVLRNTSQDTGVIVTQYISGFLQDKAINDKNIEYLQSNFPNFLYSKDFEKIDNISQMIVPWADITCSISSTIGLQAKFFDKVLISPSNSHLSYFADSVDLNFNVDYKNKNKDLIAILLCRQTLLENKILNDSQFLVSYLVEMKKNQERKKSGVGKLPKLYNDEMSQSFLINYDQVSNFQSASRQLIKLGKEDVFTTSNDIKNLIKRYQQVDVISFDIFDTLLCRSLFKPEDLFLLMQKKLEERSDFSGLPLHIRKTFPQLRVGVERQIRRERDQLIKNGENVIEEISIREVYTLMMERFEGDISYVNKLILLEQDMEHSVLYPRPIGKYLFEEALKLGKTIIIVSDFIHDELFVTEALQNSGYIGYDKLFVSSTVGKKKHSGDLFNYVANELNINLDRVLHIGDNKIGDFQKAIDAGWTAVKISSTREKIIDILRQRKLSPAIVDNSFFLRTTFSLFGEENYPVKVIEDVKKLESVSKDRELVESGSEFGYLALGPILYSFAEWIIEKALEEKAESIIFFARDCYLPFEIVKKILKEKDIQSNFKIHYIAASRIGLMGLNIYKPEDFFDVRIDDFARNNTLSSLLERRFGLNIDEIDKSILTKWNIENTDMNVGKMTPAAIYGVVYDYARDDWYNISEKFESKRMLFKKYLEREGVNLDKKTLAVDFGYKGSTHKMLNGLFTKGLTPAFFMTYANEFGQDPINGSNSYFFKNLNPLNKQVSVMLNHNLIMETLINEPVGTFIGIEEFNHELTIVREKLGSSTHISKINDIHRGVLKFADNWLRFHKLNNNISLEMNSADYILTEILRKPTLHEASLLEGLLFDNSFGGHDVKYLLSPNKNAKENNSLWKEGYSVTQKGLKEIANKNRSIKTQKEIKKIIPKIEVKDTAVLVNKEKYPKKINALRVLHREEFIKVVSALSKFSPNAKHQAFYTDLVKNKTKRYVAAKLLHENGGILKSDLSKIEKIKTIRHLVMKK